MAEKVRDVMTAGVECIEPDATVIEAAKKMQTLNVGPLPVCEEQTVVGMLTDRDITVRAVAEGRDPGATRVREIMTTDVAWCYEDQDLDQAAQLMKDREVRRLPVVSQDKRLLGIVSLGDLAVYAKRGGVAGEVLERVSQPAEPER
jgi:CBS domain-containing protein